MLVLEILKAVFPFGLDSPAISLGQITVLKIKRNSMNNIITFVLSLI